MQKPHHFFECGLHRLVMWLVIPQVCVRDYKRTTIFLIIQVKYIWKLKNTFLPLSKLNKNANDNQSSKTKRP